MADLCGGHPADVLIAVCLAALRHTVPAVQLGAVSVQQWAGGLRAGRKAHGGRGMVDTAAWTPASV